MEPSVLRGPWPGNRHATLRRGSHERKIVAGYAKSAYPITRKVAQRVMEMKAISMKATRCPRSKMVCVLQTYMGKEFNVNGQTV
jgi:hypothetical protein